MSNTSKEEVIEWLSNQTVLSLSEIVKELENKWGVKAAASVAVAAAASGGGDKEPAAEEKDSFDAILKSFGQSKIAVVKVVREITGLGLKESKELVDNVPKSIKEGVNKEECSEIEKKLKAAGAEVEFK